jgi:mono/diheme cytochrome c family protein
MLRLPADRPKMLMQPLPGLIALSLLAATTSHALAQEAGDWRKGRALAVQVCAACHGIDKSPASPNADAPAFAVVASTPGMSARALTVALQTSHRTMPNLMLGDGETRDVIAYILSLKSGG